MKIRYNIIVGICITLLSACQDIDFSNDFDIESPIRFSTSVPIEYSSLSTRSAAHYSPLPKDYTLNISMMQENVETPLISKQYTIKENETDFDPEMYWPGNGTEYGFKATAGDESLQYVTNNEINIADQTTISQQIKADYLLGYAGTQGNHDNITYNTAKEWYNNNQSKTIPLFLEHQKARITVILKAGEGVNPNDLIYQANNLSLTDTIFGYNNDKTISVLPFAANSEVTYNNEDKKATTCFTAIVDPFDYGSSANEGKPITRIVLHNQKYTFYSSLDSNGNKENYNLTAGKHLEITITIGHEGRIIFVNAQLKDWILATNEDFSVDDFGHAADPYLISSSNGETTGFSCSLKSFLDDSSEKNAKGNIAILNNNINLTDIEGDNSFILNSTLNLNGKTITTSKRIFDEISETGSLKNGIILLVDGSPEEIVTSINKGYISNIKLESTDKHLTIAGFTKENQGAIIDCSNNIPIIGNSDYIGGIAAINSGTISNCICYAKVSSNDENTITGGITGLQSDGEINNCNYEYGVTVSQKQKYPKAMNIIGRKTGGTAQYNKWPTTDINEYAGTNTNSNQYTGIIDNSDELKSLLATETNNTSYRIAEDITLTENWDNSKDLKFNLDGNGHTIISNGKCIFHTITSTLSNLKVHLNESIIDGSTDEAAGMAAVAYSLDNGTLLNIELSGASHIDNDKKKIYDIKIQSRNVGGLVVTANGNIINCINRVPLVSSGESTTVYVGGIAAITTNATITGCINCSTAILKLDEKHSTNVYSGGIVGKCSEENGTVIKDCSNFATQNCTCNGGIVGKSTVDNKIGISTGCIGNWWININPVGEGNSSYLGKKNSIIPIEP